MRSQNPTSSWFRRLVERLYRSPLGWLLSVVAHAIARLQRPFMLYGCQDPASGVFRKFVRLGSTVTILNRERLALADHIWVGHFSVLDASGGLTIGEGVQIGVGVCIYTHGSHNAIRLSGREYVNLPEAERPGYVRAPVVIGRYSFIGSGAIILPGVHIGDGVIIGPNAVVAADVPDRAILMAPPSRVVGDTRDSDREYIRQHGLPASYFDPDGVEPQAEASAARSDKPDPPKSRS